MHVTIPNLLCPLSGHRAHWVAARPISWRNGGAGQSGRPGFSSDERVGHEDPEKMGAGSVYFY